jgi:muramoyltetrapeptide carboxypeptidase
MLPATADAPRVLYLEDIGTKPYQWDRMLLHLRYAGMLEGVTGIVFGDMRQCVAAEQDALLEGAILHALRDFDGPIAIGLRSGHVDTPNVTVPLGVRVRLDLRDAPRLAFLERAVVIS